MRDSVPKYTLEVRPPRLGPLPIWAKYGIWISVAASWIPLALIVKARSTRSGDARIMIMQDMGTQPKYREQQSSEVFADGRADRLPVRGTVARGEDQNDDHYWRGYPTDIDPQTGIRKPRQIIDPKTNKPDTQFYDMFPQQVKVTDDLLRRGQNRFGIYCAPCHGFDGAGHGMVNERGLELTSLMDPETNSNQAKWIQAADLRSDQVRARPVGHIYNTINVGIRSMPAYGPQVPVADRWAIVAYVRALQVSQPPAPSTQPAQKTADAR